MRGQHTYKQTFPVRLQGRLKRTQCTVPECHEYTHLAPYCKHHAAELLGIEVKPSPRWGLGLFAVRRIELDHVIAVYMGSYYPKNATAPLTPYLMHGTGGGLIDASRERSWASMANHCNSPNVVCTFIDMPESFRDENHGILKRVTIVTESGSQRILPGHILRSPLFTNLQTYPVLVTTRAYQRPFGNANVPCRHRTGRGNTPGLRPHR